MTTTGSKYRGTQKYHLVYCRLIGAAQRKEEVLYSEIAGILGIAPSGHHMAREVGQVLGEVSEDEHSAGRPMLSAIAVSVKGYPGEGFFVLARRLGTLTGAADTELAFWMAEELKVWETWRQVG